MGQSALSGFERPRWVTPAGLPCSRTPSARTFDHKREWPTEGNTRYDLQGRSQVIVCAGCRAIVADYSDICPKCGRTLGRRRPRGPSADRIVNWATVGEPERALSTDDPRDPSAPGVADPEEISPQAAQVITMAGSPPRVVVRTEGASSSQSPTGIAVEDEDQSRCRRCRTHLRAGFWFCPVCGTQARVTPQLDPSVGVTSWRQRGVETVASDGQMNRRRFDRAMQAANLGRRVGYDRPLAPSILMYRSAVAFVALGSLLLLLLPSASGIRSSVHDRADDLIHPTFLSIPLETATTRPAQFPPPGFAPTDIAAGKMQTPWAVRWSNARHSPEPASPCQLTSTGASGNLFIGFTAPSSIDRMVIQAGISHTDARWAQLDRPALIYLVFSDRTCVRIPLADQFTPQNFGLDLRNVTSVIVVVAGVYPAETRDAGVTAISSVSFMHRRPHR
jgi:hypothetical protein